ncbi:unnamed protein product [Ostreobium quekettii]|uniref:UBC core domain-containing protein n=1 Tax=Ostreobium quekettii TaxID=121088 RepID=A0A8S1JBR9_9CHLO|nr:unnamed protein product [Ostreobium quekettii]|eukprot:evm.model.scf_281.10 EVM.evm.TU.scf_281.10   scf_281:83578-88616(-)
MKALRGAVSDLQGALVRHHADGDPPVASLVLDDTTVAFDLLKPDGPVHVSVVLFEADRYPKCAPLLACEDDLETAAMLDAIAVEFRDGGELARIVARICESCGLGCPELEALAAEGGATDSGSNGGNAYGSDGESLGGSGFVDGLSEEENASSFGLEEEEDQEMVEELGKLQGRWQRHEDAWRERARAGGEEGGPSAVGRSASESVAQTRQIFDEEETFRRLCKELLDIKREQENSMTLLVDAIDDDIYRWCVNMAGFNPSSCLAEDILEMSRLYCDSSVQIHMTFKRGLYPFYPPQIEVVRPRFKMPLAWAVASHPMFHLSNWDPWLSPKAAILQIKDFLENHARIDLNSPLNAPREGAYSDAERQLARLEALSELPPRCLASPQFAKLYESRGVAVDKNHLDALMLPDAKRMKPKPKGKEYWAAGTGYGHGSGSTEIWDAKASELAQRAHDAEVEKLLMDLDRSLATELGCLPGDGISASTSPGPSGNNVQNDVNPDKVCALLFALEGSCLLPFLHRELSCASFTDMCKRPEYYLSIMKVVHKLCHPFVAHLLHSIKVSESSNVSSILDSLQLLHEPATNYGRMINLACREAEMDSERRRRAGLPTPSNLNLQAGSPLAKRNLSVEKEEKMGRQLSELVVLAVGILMPMVARNQGSSADVPCGHPSTSGGCGDEGYIQTMKAIQLDFVEGLEGYNAYGPDSQRELSFPKERVVRLSRELSGLRSLLPCTASSSVFVRVDEQKLTLWQAIITGPEDTPYSGGCFLFDLYFPTGYPSTPPNVNLKTTGGGTVRFNPNLYNCGKVCLSLLGTWSGSAGERWDAEVSSAFQVLVSIQSLILVPEPYFNEPGYEEAMHTAPGKQQSKAYNQEIREHSIHRAMIDYLRAPPKGFEHIVRTHFLLRGDHILATCRKWIAEAEEAKCSTHASRLKGLVEELGRLLQDLKQR